MNISTNLFEVVDDLILKEKQMGVIFDAKGFPFFADDEFLSSSPKTILPYRHRLASNNPKNTAVCFYEPDIALYRHLPNGKLAATRKELLNYVGFVGFDMSIFTDLAYAFQEFYILANLVIDKYFTLCGNKMIPNLRADFTGGKSYFYLFEKAPIVCCGTLGCSQRKQVRQLNISLISRYANCHKNQIIIQYGSNLVKSNNTVSIKNFGRSK